MHCDLSSRFLSSRERETDKFRVAVSVPAGAEMLFFLSYEELLPRRLGRYELSLGLRPGQLVQNLTVEVSVTEQRGISFIKVLPLKTSRLLSSTAQGNSGRKRQALPVFIHRSRSLLQLMQKPRPLPALSSVPAALGFTTVQPCSSRAASPPKASMQTSLFSMMWRSETSWVKYR